MQLVFTFPANPSFTFANFVVCTGNQAAFHFARQLADGTAAHNLLYLYGPAGAGKSHLLAALRAAIACRCGAAEIPCVSFAERSDDTPPEPAMAPLAELFHNAPALLLDDMDCFPDNGDLHGELWQLFNDFHTAGLPIVVTGTVPPQELPTVDDHLRSRFLWGVVARLDISDDDSRRVIMKKLAADRQIRLTADVIDHLITHLPRDLPTLAALLDSLQRQAMITGRRITPRLVREVLSTEGIIGRESP